MTWRTAIAPMKAVVAELPPNSGAWVSELKWDGMRMLVHVGEDELILRSASGRTTTGAFPELASLQEAVPPGSVLDGEAIVMTEEGPSFRSLQHRIHVAEPSAQQRSAHPVSFVVFDLLWFDYHDVTSLPFSARRSALEDCLDSGLNWSVSPLSTDSPHALFEVAKEQRLEGIVCKRLDSKYLEGARSSAWRKIKVRPRTDMVVGGWFPGTGSLSNTIGSLVVGVAEGGGFRCAGAVGSGITDADRERLQHRFISRDHPPFDTSLLAVKRKAGPVQWVEPTIVVEVGFARWDPGESLWQPTFHGIRYDTDPLATEYRQGL